MDLELAGKTAIVTGGSRGIGKAIARELGQEGVDVAIVSRGREALESTARELAQETGRRFIPIPADTGNEESVKAMVQQAAAGLGHLDILVNSAARVGGGSRARSFGNHRRVLLGGYERQSVRLPALRQGGRAPHAPAGMGRIINISGLAARQSGSAVGSMRNVSVAAMTKNLADELGPHGINVTVVHPGLTRTERTAGMVEELASREGISTGEAEERMAQGVSIRRIIDAREIAYVVTFLASPKAVAINGDALPSPAGLAGQYITNGPTPLRTSHYTFGLRRCHSVACS